MPVYTPPTDDPSLPSFLHPDYVTAQDDVQLVSDVWGDLKNRIPVYIQQEQKEPGWAYQGRLKRCAFDNRFEPAIRGHAGLLTTFDLNEDVAPSIAAITENIDNCGNSIRTFFNDVDQMVLRDGWCGVYVDYPKADIGISSNGDFLDSGRRPYLVAIDRRDILDWWIEYPNGVPTLDTVIVRERRLLRFGTFGVQEQIYYRVLTPGGYVVYQINTDNNGKPQLILIESGKTSLDFIPLVYYSVSESKFFNARPPFLNLARLNIEHFQKRSQLNQVLWKCNLPVPVRKGLIATAADLKTVPPLTIGPNSALDIPAGGDFYFAEPSGVAIAATKQDIADLEAAMDRMSLAFLTGSESDKTATEVLLNAAQTNAILKEMAGRKQSAIQQIFEYWVQYTGESVGGTVTVDDTILQMPLSPDQIRILESLVQVGLISHETLLLVLRQGKVLPQEFDVQKEIQMTRTLLPGEPFYDPTDSENEDETESGNNANIGPASGTSGGTSN